MGKLIIGKNDFETWCKQNNKSELLSEWDYDKNGDVLPSTISAQTHKAVYWKCSLGHSYFSRVQNVTLGSRCPYCSGRKPIKGETDLSTTNPDVLEEWDYTKNTIAPEEVTAGSERKVFWVGKCGHSYLQMIANHVNGHGCPVCAGKTVVEGVNDLASQYPEIAKEWDYKKNILLPTQVASHSNKSAWWLCEKGHSYKMSIGNRTAVRPSGCPVCSKEIKTSFSEQAIFHYVKQVFPDTINGDRSNRIELDIYIPSIQTAIEYDGAYWHNTQISVKKDNRKDSFCKEHGIRLIRFRDVKLSDTELAERISCVDGNNKSLEVAIRKLFELLGVECPSINLSKDTATIMSEYVYGNKDNSLAVTYPDIAKEWNYEKNGALTPDKISYGSGKKVWWKCTKCNLEWLCAPNARTGEQQQNCPKCTKTIAYNTIKCRVRNVDTGQEYDSLVQAAKDVNGRPGDISTACSGRQKTAFGYRWEYVNGPRKTRIKYKGKVINTDNNMVFNSLGDAANWCGGKLMNISACCRGRQKTAYGYHWKYYNE